MEAGGNHAFLLALSGLALVALCDRCGLGEREVRGRASTLGIVAVDSASGEPDMSVNWGTWGKYNLLICNKYSYSFH